MEVVRRAQAGDREAFETLVEQLADDTYRLAAAIVGEVEARDLTQETFLVAWQQLPQLRDVRAFPAWLRRICVNRCRNSLRGRPGRGRSTSLDSDDALAGSLPDSRHDFRGAVEARAILEPAFQHLNPDQRAVLALHYSMGYSLAETADALGLRAGTVKSRLNAALNVLRRAVGSSEGSPELEGAR